MLRLASSPLFHIQTSGFRLLLVSQTQVLKKLKLISMEFKKCAKGFIAATL